MARAFVSFMVASVALGACSGGTSSVDERFAAFCETETMFKNSEPCRNPENFSDEQKERIMKGMAELEEGMDKMQSGLDAAVEEAQRSVDEAAGQ
ncbi:hypothetical protein [Qipengyuania vesicularis]|uniref:hypothetical protein n=1 Tax=Qipengyuania vesicularis TaxID=2867232 RepID=UPI001C8789DD|nr:hypothetical protein [Qipengyuania vesicularis]MBX7527315.1 hypothetical protein [Qipengyuania vesicularis]